MLDGIILPFFVGIVSNVATHALLSYFEARRQGEERPDRRQSLELFGWSLVPLLVVLAVLVLLEYRWPLPLWGKASTVAGGFALALSLVVVSRKLLPASGGLLLVFTVCFASFYLLDQFLPRFLDLDCPGEVEGRSLLSGRIVRPDWRVYVLVTPELGGSFAHSVPFVDRDGAWFVPCPFGGGHESRFRVIALGIPRDRVAEIPPALSQTPEKLHQYLLDAAPYRSSTCLVTKR